MVFLASAMSPMLTACDNDNNPWDNIPQNIAEFIEQYYPNFALESATDNDSGYHIRLKNGPGMTFNADGSWTDINGYGMPIVQVFLFDQLPPKLYNYLQETQQLNAVFSITRDNDYYTLDLLEFAALRHSQRYNHRFGCHRRKRRVDFCKGKLRRSIACPCSISALVSLASTAPDAAIHCKS